MTRLAVLADIHGNLPALEAVVDHMAQFNVDQVIVAGDIVNWGPFSAAVAAYVMDSKWTYIRGNNEYYLLDYGSARQPEAWRDYGLMAWLQAQLPGKWQHIIGGWPDTLQLRYQDAPPILVCHGTPFSPWITIFPQTTDDEVRELLRETPETTLICAHSHISMDRQVRQWHLVNCGSVGLPLDADPRAEYVILDGDESSWQATFHRVAYDRAPIYAEFERQHFVENYGAEAYLVIEEFKTARIQLHTCQAWRRVAHPGEPFTIAMAQEFLTQDTEEYRSEAYRLDFAAKRAASRL